MILNIESSTKNCSVSLSNQGTVLALKEINNGQFSHSEFLHVFIKELMEENAVSFEDLSAVAVSMGPGSYTGLRIGVSAAKGICFSVDCPLIVLDSLDVLAHQAVGKGDVLIPVIDARRDEVYTAIFDKLGKRLGATEALILTSDSYNTYDTSKRVFLGDAIDKLGDYLRIKEDDLLISTYPSSRELGQLAWHKFQQKDFEDVAYFEPYYLKDFRVTPSKK
ncbi:tRNA (adenosine(37)-N6)-threonylcarbamoyltransferase complex dimerization subunit type 1 TsaB [Flavobacteriaceae bacterium]|nr:tRNA (adenosine(37)-N6)-threonylcarbamoyltransferase complex dimerization subunit type 1 TsaB [Flavobacteriaceae bacterium]